MKQGRTPRHGLGITDYVSRPEEVHIEQLVLDVPGLMFAGWWEDSPPPVAEFDALSDRWPAESVTVLCYEESLAELRGRGFQILAYVHIVRFPEDAWMEAISASLEFFVDSGAAVAWAGGYECIVRYTPDTDFAGCYAAFTRAGGLVCLGGLDEPLRYLSDYPDVIEDLKRSVRASQKWNTGRRC